MMISGFCLDRFHRDKDRSKYQVHHDTAPEVYHRHVEFVRTLRPVPQSENETSKKSGKVKPLKDNAQNPAYAPQQIISAKRGGENPENQKEISL